MMLLPFRGPTPLTFNSPDYFWTWCQWNHTGYTLLCVASFIRHSPYRSHLCCCVWLQVFHSWSGRVFLCVNTPLTTYLCFADGHGGTLQFRAITNGEPMNKNIPVYVLQCTQMLACWCTPGSDVLKVLQAISPCLPTKTGWAGTIISLILHMSGLRLAVMFPRPPR